MKQAYEEEILNEDSNDDGLQLLHEGGNSFMSTKQDKEKNKIPTNKEKK